MAGKTRVLVTNQLHFLGHEQVAQILVMEGGRIVERGRQSELESDPESRYSKMLASTGHSKAEKAEEEAIVLAQEEHARQRSASSVSSGDAAAEKQEGAGADKARLTRDEGKREGAVTMSTFRFYFQHLGGGHVFALMVLSCWLFNLSEVGSDFYMALYQDGVIESEDTWALTVWICVAVAGGLATLFSRLLWVGLTMKACGAIHSSLVRRVLHCPTSFFDRTPSGRIMNRLGEDQMLVDWTAALVLEVLCICSWQSVDMLAIVIFARPLCAPIVAAMACLFLAMREVHRRASRETIRWWMITKSPMFHNIEETLSGASTIYAFGREGYFFRKFQGALHLNLQWLMARNVCIYIYICICVYIYICISLSLYIYIYIMILMIIKLIMIIIIVIIILIIMTIMMIIIIVIIMMMMMMMIIILILIMIIMIIMILIIRIHIDSNNDITIVIIVIITIVVII